MSSNFPVSRKQDDQFVLCRFVVVVIVIFCAFKVQITIINRAQVGPRPLDQAPVSHVLQRSHVLSCTHHTNFDAGHVQMQQGVRLLAWSVHVRPQQHWVAELQPPHHQCLHPQSPFNSMICSLVSGDSAGGSCNPDPRLPSDFIPSKVPKASRLLFRMHRTQS